MIGEHQVHPHVESEKADLFHCHDPCSTEIEYLLFWQALVSITKAENILETGSYHGWGTLHLALGCKQNGFGKLYSIEYDDSCFEITKQKLKENELDESVDLIKGDTRDFLRETDVKFDLAFFDSNLDIRMEEFRICLDRGLLKEGDYAVFHDSSKVREFPAGTPDPHTKIFWEEFEKVCGDYDLEGQIQFPLSRGLLLVKI
jgi:predicted O-methyltransferase YrrM